MLGESHQGRFCGRRQFKSTGLGRSRDGRTQRSVRNRKPTAVKKSEKSGVPRQDACRGASALVRRNTRTDNRLRLRGRGETPQPVLQTDWDTAVTFGTFAAEPDGGIMNHD